MSNFKPSKTMSTSAVIEWLSGKKDNFTFFQQDFVLVWC